MKTTSATRTGDKKRPLFNRVARKWYSWAGLALLTTASYLAFDGQLKIGGQSLLKAASLTDGETAWSPIPPEPDATPAVPAENEIKEPGKLPDDLQGPDLFAVPPQKTNPLAGSPAGTVLNAYVNGQTIVQAGNDEVRPIELPPIPAPTIPLDKAPAPLVQEPVNPAQPMQQPINVNPAQPVQQPVNVNPAQPVQQPVNVNPAQPVQQPVNVNPAQPVQQPVNVNPAQPVQQPVNVNPAQPVQQPVNVNPAQPVQQPVNINPAQPVQQPVNVKPSPAVQQSDIVIPAAPAQPPVNQVPLVREPVGVKPAPMNTESVNDRPRLLPPTDPNHSASPDAATTNTALGSQQVPVPPGNQLPIEAGEPIPTRPTQEKALNSALAAEVESLTSREQILYEAAQNSAKLKDWAKTSEYFEQLLKSRPNLIYVRAEYAGLMVTAGEIRRAVELYRRVLEMKPDSVLYRIRLGDAYVIAKDFKSAIRLYSEVLRSPPYEPEYAVRLARAYVFDNDYNRAFQVYDNMLAKIKPEDPRAPIALGALLLDLDLPYDAIPYLLEKRRVLEKEPRRREITLLEVLGSIIRAHARLGERQAAMEVINEMPMLAIDQIGIRITLADQLFAIEEYELAAQVFNQALQLEPTNGQAIIGMARIYLEMSHPAEARQILDSFRPAPLQMRDYLTTYAIYHQRIGEYIEARQIYNDMLRRNENDHATRYALGVLDDLAFGKDEWERAKAEFAKIPPTDRLGRDARRAFANTLANQRKFQEALEIDRMLLIEDPFDFQTVAQATRTYAKARMYEQGIALARGFLATGPRAEGQAVTVRLALGRALLEAGRYLDAVREYEILISRPSGRKIEAYYGLVRAHEKLGNNERAKQFLACMSGLPGGEFRNRLILAELYAADYDDRRAIEICLSLLNREPKHLPSMIRLADCQQRLSRFSGNPADVFQTAIAVLNLSASNVRAHMAMARSFAVAQNYRKACGQYDQLIQLDPSQYGPRLERARCLYADKQYSAARSAWEQVQKPGPDEQLITEINDIITRNPKMRAFLEPYIIGGIAGPGLRKELGRLAVTVPDAELRLAIQRLMCDYDAVAARNTASHLEEQGMELKDYRYLQALPALQAASQFEPTNVDTLFALGQQLGTLHRNSQELNVYNDLLTIDPTNRDTQAAAERSQADMSPKLDLLENYFTQRGRQGLADITREKWTVDGRIPLGDENEYLEIGYTRAIYHSRFDYPDSDGNIPFFRVQKRFCDDLLLAYGQVNVEQYNTGFSERPTFDIGAIYQCCDWVWLRGGGYLENVAENGESIRQDIYRGGVYTGADFMPTRLWAFGGQYQYAHYSDNNDMNAFTLYNELQLTEPPKMLKLAERLYFWGYRESTVFPTNPPQEDNIFGAVHPYFAPSAFSEIEVRLEWWHWLSRDYFEHSNQCYYSLQYGIMSDSNLVTYHNLRALFNYDVCTWLTIGAEADAQLSSVYKMFSAMGYLQIRFK